MTDQTPLWTSSAAIAATGGSCPVNWAAFGVSIDTRTLQKGDLFVALPGPSFDGHDFIVKALEAGAAAALGHRRPDGLAKDAPFLQVTDALAALRDLAAARRRESQARIVAVTGSVGKTSTKEALRQCLAASGATHASSASHNNHWGVPLSLARLPLAARFGVFEVGMNHADEIRPLTKLARPHVAVITMIAPAHIENFREGLIGIADAKSEIFEGLEPGGTAVLPRDIALYHHLHLRAIEAGAANFLSFGRHKEADVRLIDCKLNPTCSAVSAEIAGEKMDYCLSLPGEHMVMNSLAVLAAVKAAGGDLVLAAAEMARLPSLKGRGQRQRITMPEGAFDLIDDSYNANPASMRAAFAVLAQASLGAGGRRLAVLGDMLELGAQAKELHEGLAPDLLAAKVDRVFLCGPTMKALWEKLPVQNRGAYGADSSALAPQVAAAIQPGDTVLVKGSLGSRMAVVVAALSALATKQKISA